MRQKPRHITLPETWDELTEADWRELLKMRQQAIRRGLAVTIEDVRIETARLLLQNRGVPCQPNRPQYLVLLHQLAATFDWLWKEDNGTIQLTYCSVLNKLPKVRDWLGPLDCGSDITFGEFRQAVAHVKAIENSTEGTVPTVPFQALAGLLYRPEASETQKHQGLRRQPYDWDTLDEQIARGAQMKAWQTWGIYAWFSYFCEALTTLTFTIEGDDYCFAPLFTTASGKTSGGHGSSLANICFTLAESHVFGTVKDVDHTPLFDVMRKLLQDYYTLQDLKKKKK